MKSKFEYYCHNCGKVETYLHEIHEIKVEPTKTVIKFIDCCGNKIEQIINNAVSLECPYCLEYGFTTLTIKPN